MSEPIERYLAAAVQLDSTSDADANWASARALIERAVSYGARLVATPENTNFLGPHEEKVRRAEPLDGRALGRWLLRHPFMTLGVIARIHWQALRLAARRVRFHRKPPPPLEETT